MSNTASEVLSDLLESVEAKPLMERVGNIDKHRTEDKAWAAIELKSRERFLITVEKVR